jgi:Uma2 family endonuclease
MTAAAILDPLHDRTPQREDHFVRLRCASWADYERVLTMRGDRSTPRIAFLDGLLEIMSPSQDHERIKSTLGRLVEIFCLERGITFSAFGSWTLKDAVARRAVEPDECYVLGERAEAVHPDLAIEVDWSRGGIDKLTIYATLGVPELWRFRAGKLEAYSLRGERYEAVAESQLLSGIDLDQLTTFLDRPSTSQAMRDYRAALQAASG